MLPSHLFVVNEQPNYTTLQDAEYLNSICGVNATVPNGIVVSNKTNMEDDCPYLRIIEQPTKTFRYRYESEKGSHGPIKGQTEKSFPIVKLENYPSSCREKVIIRVSLYTNEPEPKPHFHNLLKLSKRKKGKNCSQGNEKCESRLDEDFKAVFSFMEISAKKMDEVLVILKQRKISYYVSNEISYDEASLETEIKEEMRNNFNSAKLCFEAFSTDDMDTHLCERVFSSPINNQKSAGDPKIVRLSRCTGECSGGDEVYLLCEKIQIDDIQVIFYEDSDEGVWEDFGVFNNADVHKGYVIVFKTPKYRKTNVHKEVYIKLFRPSDGKCSEPRPFNYVPDTDLSEISKKRKRPNPEKGIQVSDYSVSPVNDFVQTGSDGFNGLMDLSDVDSKDFDLSFLHNLLDDKEIENVDSKDFDFDILNQRNEEVVDLDCISASLDLLEIDKHKQELETSKKKKASKDFTDGMQTMLQNRYLHYAPHLIHLEDENGNNMLHLAILEQSRNGSLIRKMLEMVSEDVINWQNKFKETPLHLAIKGNHKEIFLILLVKDGNPNLLDADGNNCLHLAAKYGHAQLLKLMLSSEGRRARKYEISDIDMLNYDGMTALQIAVARHFEDCVTVLLKFKADVNIHELKGGKTSVHLAIDQPSILRTILKQPETDVHAKDFGGYTPVHLACLKTGKSFEVISTQLNDDKEKIIKFLENINQNSERESDLHLVDQSSEAESDRHSTDSSDFEGTTEELIPASCKEVNCKAVSTDERVYINEKKLTLMKAEEELYKYLDKNENWKKLAYMIELNPQIVELFDRELSPGRTVFKQIQNLYHLNDIDELIEILKCVGLEEGVEIVQKNS